MNEERWILAQLKRKLAKLEAAGDERRVVMAYAVLTMIAEIEAEAVLGEDVENVKADPMDAGAGFRYEEVE